jgi:WD40 repeat protein
VYHSLDNERSKAETCEICVWSFDATTDQITQTQLIEAGIGLRNVVMAEDFIVGACAERKIHVWNRRTKEKMPYILCDVDEDDEIVRIDLVYARCMSLHGHTFVTNSYLGCALCVWNVKTGELLKKYNDAVDGQWVDLLPDRTDVTSMAYLKHLNGFVLTDGYLKVWTFPTNQDQKDRAVAICRREQDLR